MGTRQVLIGVSQLRFSGLALYGTCCPAAISEISGCGIREGVPLMRHAFLCKENPRIVRGFSISFSGDFPKTKQKTSHDIEYGNAVCKLPYQFIYLGGFLHEIKRVLSK